MHSVEPARSHGTLPRPFGTRYQLLRHLATGGMADVFLARQLGGAGFVKECVIKRILPHLADDQQFVTMFLDEARVCARLNHPNIAQVYDHGREGEDYFIAMEHVDGVDLDKLLDKLHAGGEKRMNYAVAARIVCGVADGLEHAHNALDERGQPLGLVHRDVTPSNVVVSFEGVPKLLDFGIAKASSRQGKTEVGIIKGKVPYMSPEQVMGEPLDGRSDLFSLGCILYELTTGDKPFAGQNSAELGLKILHDEPTPPTLLIGDFPEALEGIITCALAKRPEERVASARALQLQLERFLSLSGTPMTSHDVAAYLLERFERPRMAGADVATFFAPAAPAFPPPPQSHPQSIPRGENRSMEEPHKGRPTGPLSIGEGPLLDELPGAPRKDARRSLGGGGGAMAIVAAVVVVAVAAGFFLLRGYQLNKENAIAGDAAGAESAGANPAVAPPAVAAPGPGVVPAAPAPIAKPIAAPESATPPPSAVTPVTEKAVPEKPAAVAAPAKPIAPAIPDQPRVTPLAAEPKKPSHAHHSSPATPHPASQALPKLPPHQLVPAGILPALIQILCG